MRPPGATSMGSCHPFWECQTTGILPIISTRMGGFTQLPLATGPLLAGAVPLGKTGDFGCVFMNPSLGVYHFTLWLFNIAMENGPFIDDFPIKTSIYKGFSMAMLNYQRVIGLKHQFGVIISIIPMHLRYDPVSRMQFVESLRQFCGKTHSVPIINHPMLVQSCWPCLKIGKPQFQWVIWLDIIIVPSTNRPLSQPWNQAVNQPFGVILTARGPWWRSLNQPKEGDFAGKIMVLLAKTHRGS